MKIIFLHLRNFQVHTFSIYKFKESNNLYFHFLDERQCFPGYAFPWGGHSSSEQKIWSSDDNERIRSGIWKLKKKLYLPKTKIITLIFQLKIRIVQYFWRAEILLFWIIWYSLE